MGFVLSIIEVYKRLLMIGVTAMTFKNASAMAGSPTRAKVLIIFALVFPFDVLFNILKGDLNPLYVVLSLVLHIVLAYLFAAREAVIWAGLILVVHLCNIGLHYAGITSSIPFYWFACAWIYNVFVIKSKSA